MYLYKLVHMLKCLYDLFFQALRILLFGTPYTGFNSDWRKQHINFFSNMSYTLSFYKVICDVHVKSHVWLIYCEINH